MKSCGIQWCIAVPEDGFDYCKHHEKHRLWMPKQMALASIGKGRKDRYKPTLPKDAHLPRRRRGKSRDDQGRRHEA